MQKHNVADISAEHPDANMARNDPTQTRRGMTGRKHGEVRRKHGGVRRGKETPQPGPAVEKQPEQKNSEERK